MSNARRDSAPRTNQAFFGSACPEIGMGSIGNQVVAVRFRRVSSAAERRAAPLVNLRLLTPYRCSAEYVGPTSLRTWTLGRAVLSCVKDLEYERKEMGRSEWMEEEQQRQEEEQRSNLCRAAQRLHGPITRAGKCTVHCSSWQALTRPATILCGRDRGLLSTEYVLLGMSSVRNHQSASGYPGPVG